MKDILLFISGIAIGSVVTWKLIEEKYKTIADEEIKSVIDEFKKDNDKKENNNINIANKESFTNIGVPSTEPKKSESIMVDTYAKKVNDLEYDNTKNNHIENKEKEVVNKPKKNKNFPYIISRDEFGILDDWDTKDWMYWNDDVLTDENDQPIIEYESIIGDEALLSFDYETGSVYVRNDQLHCDYEILRSEKNFQE